MEYRQIRVLGHLYIIGIHFLINFQLIGQEPYREIIETDSSNIEIGRNSYYRIYKETYKKNDSIWYNVTFIDDTTKLNTEGWYLKNGKHLGIWKEYNKDGDLIYSHDYDNNTIEVNRDLYPYHDILENMKLIADSLIIDAYGKEFMDMHVRFNFDFSAYFRYKAKYSWSEDSMWTSRYLGSWTKPLESKPNEFLIRYEVRLYDDDEKNIELGILLDSLGRYIPSEDDLWNNYGFEHVKPEHKKFVINKSKAINIAKQNGLILSDSSIIEEFLFWENFRERKYFNGQFRYYITDLVGKDIYQVSKERQGVKYKYMVYIFNPWTGEFVEKKKMKIEREWENGHGLSSGLQPDEE